MAPPASGLYRTEFLYLNRGRPPTEQDQYEAYAAVVRSLGGHQVTIRTLDLGADKLVSYQSAGYAEPNPVLGLRSLRLSLRNLDLFRTQLRAILRASVLGDVRVMFPLVSTLGEFRQARRRSSTTSPGAGGRRSGDSRRSPGRRDG